ncbi:MULTISPECIES: ABC transporter permease [unclassified Salinibacterium]|uniref:ABC transporter permease n=1 Tax=unclassified Salinibacterium TaxID=2632331 RepID=UPI0018CD7136|nr:MULTISPECIES: ABC transporter permease [unclassified Salinibacterium]MBH0054847.1 ABC transporter permease [Salinibacterium sp. SWN139]MBH0084008.1 ABC transporter permease [Salinibacterium sp. SWN167]
MTLTTTSEVKTHGGSKIDRRSWKLPIAFAIVSLISGVLFIGFAEDAPTGFNLSTGTDLIQLPIVHLPALATGVIVTILTALIAVGSAFMISKDRAVPKWIPIVGAILALTGFLTWAAADETLRVPELLAGSLVLAVPLVFGALGGVISERVGVVNIAIEAQLLAGAFVSAVVGTLTGSAFAGLFAAAVAGMLVSFLLSVFAIKYLVNQIIVGVVINVLVSGLTGFLYSTWLTDNPEQLNNPEGFSTLSIPILSGIPIIGPVLFKQTLIVYLLYIIVAAVAFALYRTRWGLRLRAVGEHPKAADTVGINVTLTRFWNVALAGAIAGLGGAFITLSQTGQFGKDVTAGAGFIALAAVIFGRWDPIKATLAALLFGFASNLQNALSVVGSPVPSEFMLMLPYVVTIIAVAGLVGKSRPPAASGTPYIKG